ncbi:cytochrome c-type biogenesis CcmH-like mitochondrial protein [Cryptomeria japonica]|uniref:cytochrome c-type biogenesis CcmH-like mitochondrial protein n=1 Tax=Cryptomeria japonica TaxID=3369 RepID=UPI0027DA2D80|nr:cytochrome c-type biogenesis CcmH-like mitochondrial protein [Cryptomeria japonica]XP_057849831.2 cytochrome c-type biogenesis CcmH-like mitochondrial protein [Cryptomeria japonica]XP_057849832.2 cytochrome c-type biogenesis CcmH-like mitochondrial protein [Cryptomeria japonica]XP_057849834.2 cytochrome c-type biogenesis CcmH-like mitochondrial protein [Cryptomeria japonica]XP_057849835.2 cytochrome c-type biogenesis CcmH-like mitochondrial protein [Cryptomeria japonica]XP_057849836.2 cytoc
MGDEKARTKNTEIEARARNITHKVRCTECGSQNIEDSQADIAILLRKLIRDEIRAGKSDKEVYDKLEKDYGESILYAPRFDIQTAGIWLSPVIVAGAFVGIWAYRRYQERANVQLLASRLLRNIPLTRNERQAMLELLQPPPPKRKWWSWGG